MWEQVGMINRNKGNMGRVIMYKLNMYMAIVDKIVVDKNNIDEAVLVNIVALVQTTEVMIIIINNTNFILIYI